MRFRLLLLLFPIALVFSCTIEKRLHRSGYHIEWKKRLHAPKGEEQKLVPKEGPVAIRGAESADSLTRTSVSAGEHESPESMPERRVSLFPVISSASVGKTAQPEIQPVLHDRMTEQSPLQRHEKIQRAKPKAAVVILTAAWFIVAALLLIAGISLVSGSPVWGIILLVLAGIMLILPLLGIGGGRTNKKSSAGFAPFAPEPRLRYRFRMKPDKDMQRKAVIVFILILLYVILAILGVVFGISLLSAGTTAVGILLLVLGGLMLLIPATALIFVAVSGER